MTIGSYAHAHQQVLDFIAGLERRDPSPLRAVLAEHLRTVAEAMRAIELVDSGDLRAGNEDDAIRCVLGHAAAQLELSAGQAQDQAAIDAAGRKAA